MKYALQTTANPAPSRYRWKFVSSADGERPAELEKRERRIRWRVTGDQHYGKLLCWGENSSEGLAEPCTFLITPAVR